MRKNSPICDYIETYRLLEASNPSNPSSLWSKSLSENSPLFISASMRLRSIRYPVTAAIKFIIPSITVSSFLGKVSKFVSHASSRINERVRPVGNASKLATGPVSDRAIEEESLFLNAPWSCLDNDDAKEWEQNHFSSRQHSTKKPVGSDENKLRLRPWGLYPTCRTLHDHSGVTRPDSVNNAITYPDLPALALLSLIHLNFVSQSASVKATSHFPPAESRRCTSR